MQLKAKIRNDSLKDSGKSQSLLRIFMMERFLERISKSKYKYSFILKGGLLVSSFIGTNIRTTMDIDATVDKINLSKDVLLSIIKEIININVGDNVSFILKSISNIMDDFEYPGYRFNLDALFDGVRQPISIDISTGDIITPCAIIYQYKLMYEDRYINLLSYNLETILAEKLETIISRIDTNSRMKDYYDVFELIKNNGDSIDYSILKKAFNTTCEYRKTIISIERIDSILIVLKESEIMENNWNKYKDSSNYVEDLSWKEVISGCEDVFNRIK